MTPAQIIVNADGHSYYGKASAVLSTSNHQEVLNDILNNDRAVFTIVKIEGKTLVNLSKGTMLQYKEAVEQLKTEGTILVHKNQYFYHILDKPDTFWDNNIEDFKPLSFKKG